MAIVDYTYQGDFNQDRFNFIQQTMSATFPELVDATKPDHMSFTITDQGDGTQKLDVSVPDTVSQQQIDTIVNDPHLTAWRPIPDPVFGKATQLATPAVEVRIDQLSVDQLTGLVVCLLYNFKAIDTDTLTIKPLDQWF